MVIFMESILAQERIGTIDKSLHYVAEFDGSCLVYLVERQESLFVLKMAPLHDEWGVGYTARIKDHLTREQEVLERVKGLRRVADLEQVYTPSYDAIALLKKYVEGDALSGRISNPTTKKQLEGTVCGLHGRGISNLDLERPENVIISPDGNTATLFDFGKCKIQGVDGDYESMREWDLMCLDRL